MFNTEAPKFTAPFTNDTCTEDLALFKALVKVVHMMELQPNISRKQSARVARIDVYMHIVLIKLSFVGCFQSVYLNGYIVLNIVMK
jgi:hypothetical protein